MSVNIMKRRLACILLLVMVFVFICPCAHAINLKATVSKDTKMYKQASKSSASKDVKKGTKVTITAIHKGCARVKCNGKTGYMSTGSLTANTKTKVEKAVAIALYQCGKPYGYNSPRTFNCSSLVSYAFGKVGYKMKGLAKDQSKDNRYPLVHSSSFKTGDLIFFDENKDGTCDHVAIYVSNNSFVEASHGSGKVRVKKMDDWYRSHILCVRRVAA